MSTNKYTYQVEMTCSGCSNAVKRVLDKLGDKVQNVDINLPEKTVTVESSSLSKEDILTTLKKTGKEVKPVD